jgi:hypothetical protein
MMNMTGTGALSKARLRRMHDVMAAHGARHHLPDHLDDQAGHRRRRDDPG